MPIIYISHFWFPLLMDILIKTNLTQSNWNIAKWHAKRSYQSAYKIILVYFSKLNKNENTQQNERKIEMHRRNCTVIIKRDNLNLIALYWYIPSIALYRDTFYFFYIFTILFFMNNFFFSLCYTNWYCAICLPFTHTHNFQ